MIGSLPTEARTPSKMPSDEPLSRAYANLNGLLVRQRGESTLYQIDLGCRRRFASDAPRERLLRPQIMVYEVTDLQCITQGEDFADDVQLIGAFETGEVYLFERGRKRRVAASLMDYYQFDPTHVLRLPARELIRIDEGPALAVRAMK